MSIRARLFNLERTAQIHARGLSCTACGHRPGERPRLTIMAPPVIGHMSGMAQPDISRDRCAACGRTLVYRMRIPNLDRSVA